ncbi:hypothetical protein BH09PSE3_BH09PSE3_06370 [soil metagenome]
MHPEFSGNLYVIAVIGGQRIAVEADKVAAVVDLIDIMAVPLAPRHILGLCALRSQIVTVVDLACALGQPSEQNSRRAITMEIDNHNYAFVVSSVERVELSLEDVHAIDASIGSDWAAAVTGRVQTDSGLSLLLDPARLTRVKVEMVQ